MPTDFRSIMNAMRGPGMPNARPSVNRMAGAGMSHPLGAAQPSPNYGPRPDPTRTLHRPDHLLQSYFNSWAGYSLQASDARFLGGIKPDTRLDQYPVLKRFYVAGPARSTRHVTDFYDLATVAEKKCATGKEALDQGNVERARQIELTFENQIYEAVMAVRENLSFVRAMNETVVTTEDIQAVRDMMTYLDAQHHPGIVEAARGAWNDIGGLKRLVQNDLYIGSAMRWPETS